MPSRSTIMATPLKTFRSAPQPRSAARANNPCLAAADGVCLLSTVSGPTVAPVAFDVASCRLLSRRVASPAATLQLQCSQQLRLTVAKNAIRDTRRHATGRWSLVEERQLSHDPRWPEKNQLAPLATMATLDDKQKSAILDQAVAATVILSAAKDLAPP